MGRAGDEVAAGIGAPPVAAPPLLGDVDVTPGMGAGGGGAGCAGAAMSAAGASDSPRATGPPGGVVAVVGPAPPAYAGVVASGEDLAAPPQATTRSGRRRSDRETIRICALRPRERGGGRRLTRR